MLISINGKIIPTDKAHISVLDKAFLYGMAVFETMRTYNKKIFRLDGHLKRLDQSAKILDLKYKYTLRQISKFISGAIKISKYKEDRIRVIISSDQLIIIIEELKEKPADFYKNGVKLVSYPGRRSIPYAKVFGDPLCYIANQYAQKKKVYESILIDPITQYVRECSYANIFWVQNGKLYTVNKNILHGITRDAIIQLSGGCVQREIKLKSLLKADEVFITQTSSGILPVVVINGQKIGSGKLGKITKELMQKFKQFVWKAE